MPEPVESALARYMKEFELKKRERAIVGKLLIDFFEAERNLNHLLTIWIFDPTHEGSLDTILVNTPIRHKINAALEYSLLSSSNAKLFHRLCDDRNKLAHAPLKKKRIFDIFPPEAQHTFVVRCADLNTAMLEKQLELVKAFVG